MGISYPRPQGASPAPEHHHHTALEPGERHAITPPAPRYSALLFERAALALVDPDLFTPTQRERLIDDLREAAELTTASS